MRDKILSQEGKDYWRSVEEFIDAPEFEEFVQREYPQHAEEWDDSLSRRNFIKVMGASLALAGLSGCVIQPPEKIVPYVTTPEDMLPGKPLYFATSMTLGGIATGLLAKSYDGRPIKLEGNPEHPGSQGATDVFAQASLLSMYDPDRSNEISFRGSPRSWQNFMTEIRSAIETNRADGGAGIRFLTPTVTSPTLIAQFQQIASELPGSRWYQYEPINNDNSMAGARMALGSPAHTVYRFDRADRVLSLDADIFAGFNVGYIKDFTKRRAYSDQNKEINRLYMIETSVTITGAKADHRLAVKPSQMVEIAKAIAAAVGVGGASSTYAENAQWINAMAKDLTAYRGRSIVVAGENQPPMVHAVAHAINSALGNVGQTVFYTDPLSPFAETTQVEQLRELVADIDGERVKMLVILGGNPVYDTPADLKLNAERMNQVPLRVHLGQHFDETAALCHWHVAQTHYLEEWGDARAYDGTISMIQPLIEPLYEGHSVYEVAQVFLRENFDQKGYDIVRNYWQRQRLAGAARPAPSPAQNNAAAANIGQAPAPVASPSPTAANRQTAPSTNQTAVTSSNFEDQWRAVLHSGFVPNSALPTRTLSASNAFMTQPQPPRSTGALEISIVTDPCAYDGRFANNGWLQELPKPMTKVTWDNIALVSPATARRLGLNQGNDPDEIAGGERPTAFIDSRGSNVYSDNVTLTFEGAEIGKPVPMWIMPGQPDDVVTIFTGYGRTRAGRVGTGVGYSAYDVMRSNAMNFGTGDIAKIGTQSTIASTQIHFNMEGRDLLRVFDLEYFNQHPDAGHQPDFYDKSMYPRYEYNGNKWGMTIDLNSCVGCNACVLACQAENNIPVVGREQVERSREMHWLRVDTYYSGTDLDHPEGAHFQPILCQQCELAPCEVVCPVTATVHSAEGLNDMVYNRCVGTRYCSNNCPYKVRRFNFLLYQDWDTPQYKLMRNPEVTIRSRGVMEKCTYCTQRISAARIEAEKEGRDIRDGEIVTACEAVCPTNAIIFGDMNDSNSQVSRSKKDPRDYNLLNELNTQPRTTYLANLKNQNKEMPDYKQFKVPEVHGVEKKGEGEKSAEAAH